MHAEFHHSASGDALRGTLVTAAAVHTYAGGLVEDETLVEHDEEAVGVSTRRDEFPGNGGIGLSDVQLG